jgi:amino acid adenylation domain-containing protein
MTLESNVRSLEYYNPENNSIHELITKQSQKSPDTVAIKHKKDRITYRELEISTNQVNAFLHTKNITKGDVIAVAMDRSIPMAACLLAIMKAGGTYLPVDPNLPIERIAYILEDSSAKKIIVSKKYEELFAEYTDKIIFDDIWLNRSDYPEDFPSVDTDCDDLIYIIYTSGSTGHPKGVGVSHKGLINLLLYRLTAPGVTENDNMLGLTTMSFDIAQEELYLPLISGALLTIVDMEITRDGSALLEIVKTEHITLMQATPYIWQMMLESGWDTPLPIKIFCGGEALTNELAGKLLDRCSEVWNMYGPTETTICTTVKKITDSKELITIGKPIENARVYILDENLNKVMPGIEGELYISGVGVTKGYINRPELTAEKFIEDKFSTIPGEKMYKTGDLGRLLQNGEIQFIGRKDNQIKLRGYRIEKEEIEYQLKLQDGIKDALVTVYEDSVKNARLVAYLTLRKQLNDDDIAGLIDNCKNELKKALPEHMVPANYEVIAEMPLLPSGKINLKALPKPNIQDAVSEYTAPDTEIEKMLVEVWEDHIGIKKIGITDNFFDLGGTSLIAVKTKIQIEKLTNKRLSPSVLFKYPTIKQLAGALNDFIEEPYKSLVPIQPNGSRIPMYIVHGIGLNVLNFRNLAVDLGADQPIYGLQGVSEHPELLDTIEETAAFYNAEIIRQNPTGPYVIAGYSIGGVIAYEMVKQLKEAGKDVKALIMFDTAIQIPTHQYPILKKIYVKTFRQFPKLKFRVASFINKPKENIAYIKAVYGNKFVKGVYNKHETYGLPDYMQETIIKLKEGFNRYVILPYDVKIDLFSGEKLYYLDDPEYLGWKKYALQGITVYHVSGNHDTIFDAPHHQQVAKLLQKRLDEINN